MSTAGELEVVAARVRAHADRVRTVALVVGRLETTSWRGTAAALFRSRVEDRRRAVARLAGEVDAVAADLQVLAATVRGLT